MRKFISFSYWILCSKSSDIPLNCGYMTIEWNQVTKLVFVSSLLQINKTYLFHWQANSPLSTYNIGNIDSYFIKVYYISKSLFIH